jgi:hypothetical protein
LAWQSYGEATKQVIATTAPELGWSPEAKQTIAQKMQQLEVDIVAVRQTMEQRLAAQQQTVEQLAARQDQMASEITKLQATDQEILEKIPAPPVPLRKASFRHKHSRRLSVSTKEQSQAVSQSPRFRRKSGHQTAQRNICFGRPKADPARPRSRVCMFVSSLMPATMP